ncbi:hypothetical protein ACHAXR_003687, partial [Thalassiosira sp. AJA248-18]
MDTFGNDLSSGGQVLSREELIKKRNRNGLCPSCGQKCFKKKLFKLEPMTNPGKVLNGRCLVCNPQDPTKGEELVAVVAVAAAANKLRRGVRNKQTARGGAAAASGRAKRNEGVSASASMPVNNQRPVIRNRHSSMGDISTMTEEKEEDLGDSERYTTGGVMGNGGVSRSAPLPQTRHTEGGEQWGGGGGGGGERGSISSDRRDSLRRTSQNSFLLRQTPRPSTKFLDGINIEDLFKDDDDNNNISASEDNNASVHSSLSLSRDERKALQMLYSEDNSFLDIVNIMLMNAMSASVQNEGLHALSCVHDPDVELLEACASSCGFEVIVSAMGHCSKDAMAQTNACKVLFIASASG